VRPAGARARAVIRAPNHLGELVLALPALERAADRWSSTPLVQVVGELLPVLEMSGLEIEPLPMEDRHAVLRAGRRLRAHRPDLGILLTPSFSAALVLRVSGARVRRGVQGGGRSWLLTDARDREPLLEGHRVLEYLCLVGEPPPEGTLPAPRLREPGVGREAWRALRARLEIPAAPAGRRTVGLVPGGNAPARRWPARRFAALAGRLAGRGHRVLVFGGPAEAERSRRVAAGAPAPEAPVDRGRSGGFAVDLGGRTSLQALAGGLDACDVVVSNDTGPMHLAAALGRPVVALEGPADVRQTRPLGVPTRLVGRFSLPCVPCVRNECPRSGPGYRLEDARRECLRSIGVEEVFEATRELLRETAAEPEARPPTDRASGVRRGTRPPAGSG